MISVLRLMYYSFKEFIGLGLHADKFPQCLECGVCCSYFKVQVSVNDRQIMANHRDKIIHVVKDDVAKEGMLMLGTSKALKHRRCVAFSGKLKQKNAGCSIYEDRPQVCRKYPRELANGNINPRCIVAWKGVKNFNE